MRNYLRATPTVATLHPFPIPIQASQYMDAKNVKANATANIKSVSGPNNASFIPPAPPAPALPRKGIDQIMPGMTVQLNGTPLTTPAPMLSKHVSVRQPVQPPAPPPATPAAEEEIEEEIWYMWKTWKVIETIGVNIMLGFCANAVFKE